MLNRLISKILVGEVKKIDGQKAVSYTHLDVYKRQAFHSLVPSFHPIDLCVGVAAAIAIRLAVYIKGKNAKKFRKNLELSLIHIFFEQISGKKTGRK